MKYFRILILGFVVAGLTAGVWLWPRTSGGFPTPKECIGVYYEASKTGDVARYEQCLTEPLRQELHQRFSDTQRLREHLLNSTKDLKNWVQPEEEVFDGSQAQVDMDERRPGRRQRVRYRLEKIGHAWFIAGIGTPQTLPEHVPYNTHVSKVPEGP